MLVWFKKTSPLSGIDNSKLELSLSTAGTPLTSRRSEWHYATNPINGHSEISALFSSNTGLCSLTGE